MSTAAAISISVADGADVVDRTFDALERACEGAGFGLEDVARLRIFYVERDQIAGFNPVRSARYEKHGMDGRYPATTGVMVGRDSTGAGLRMEALLSKDRTYFNSERVPYTFGGHGKPAFTHRVASGDFAALSGQTALDMDGELPGGDAAAQATAATGNSIAVLEDGGDSFADVLRVILYVVGEENLDAASKTVAAAYGGGVEVTSILIEDLFKPGVVLEVETLAAPHGSESGWQSFARTTEMDSADTDAAFAFAEAELAAAGVALDDVAALTFWTGDRDLTQPLLDAAASRQGYPATMAVPSSSSNPRELTIEVVYNRS
jgi:enamine deaminase RidA (YjgF/YER057c/UK114 family)